MARIRKPQTQRAGAVNAAENIASVIENSTLNVRNWWHNDRVVGLFLVLITLLVYGQVWRAGFIWDDNAHVVSWKLRSIGGLERIWFAPGATQQYYPVLYTAFWLEAQLWGDAALGYHLINVLLHGIGCWLLFRILRGLGIRGAALAATAFALHPVCVESVAWISEQKNTLSAVFYFSAALTYLNFDRERRLASYGLALGIFILALMSKSVTATLPAALLVVFWFKRGRLSWNRDVLPLLPWLILGAAAGTMTAWMERTFVGATGAAYGISWLERILLAGRILVFYSGKIFWPRELNFVYPRWTIDPGEFWPYLYPAGVIILFLILWFWRKRSRAPLATALLFAGTLFPALGFLNVYPFIYSYVADHFQYLAVAVMLSATGAVITRLAGQFSPRVRSLINGGCICILGLLATLTWRQCAIYASEETLWVATNAGNPDSWLAHNNLGIAYMSAGKVGEAINQYEKALATNPHRQPRSFAGTYNNLGIALLQQGRVPDAVFNFEKSVELDPRYVEAMNNLANAYAGTGRSEAALGLFDRALAISPRDVGTNYNLGNTLFQAGRWEEAAVRYRVVLEVDPDHAPARNNLGNSLLQLGRLDDAIVQYDRAVAISPGNTEARINLGTALLQKGVLDQAIANFRTALGQNEKLFTAHTNLGFALAQKGLMDEAVIHFKRAVELDPKSSEAHRNLGSIYQADGKAAEAEGEFTRAAHLP